MTNEHIAEILMGRGFELNSKLVRDEFNGRDGDSVWLITITRNGETLQTDFRQGCAYRHYRGGRKFKPHPYGKPMSLYQNDQYMRSIPDKPTLDDVMYCIVSDAQCVAYGQTFEEFADDLGYSKDSISAKHTFDACRDMYFALIRLCGYDGFASLCELFQGY